MGHVYRDFDWYETPLFYDIVFDADTGMESDYLEAMYRKHVRVAKPDRSLIEPACGTARLMIELARRGYQVAGFDLSDGMLAFGRQRMDATKTPGLLFKAAMQDFKTPKKYDMAFCLVSTFHHLHTEDEALAHLRCVAGCLKKGGVYVLSFHLSDYEHGRIERERWVGQRDGVRVTCNIQGWAPDGKARREKVRSRLVIEQGKQPIKRYETHFEFRTYTAKQFQTLLKKAPEFELVETYAFRDDPEQTYPFGERNDPTVILRKL